MNNKTIFKLKKGYTLVEIMLCMMSLITVLCGAYTLYSKAEQSLIVQNNVNKYIIEESDTFLTINDLFLSGKKYTIDNNIIRIGDSVIEIRNDSIYINNKKTITSENNISFEAVDNGIIIHIGGNTWCFTSLNNTKEEI